MKHFTGRVAVEIINMTSAYDWTANWGALWETIVKKGDRRLCRHHEQAERVPGHGAIRRGALREVVDGQPVAARSGMRHAAR